MGRQSRQDQPPPHNWGRAFVVFSSASSYTLVNHFVPFFGQSSKIDKKKPNSSTLTSEWSIMKNPFDLVVVGAGPGGYVAAIVAAQMGAHVALVEQEHLGGTCLNVGCIPSKTLLASAELLHACKRAGELGIRTGPIQVDFPVIQARKDKVITQIRKSLQGLLESNRIEIIKGRAAFESPYLLRVKGTTTSSLLEAPKIILATGSKPLHLKTLPMNDPRIFDSTGLLNIDHIPTRLAIVGGGYIGCEFASLFQALGSQVTIFEALPSILSLQGETVAKFMTQTFKAQGIQIHANAKVDKIDPHPKNLQIHFNQKQTLEADSVLIAAGRTVYTEGLCLSKAGLTTTSRGAIEVSASMETEVSGIYAIGDLTGISMLAHVASHQGMVAACHALGVPKTMHYHAVPAVIFTYPEVATVGLDEAILHQQNIPFDVATFPFQALGKAQAIGHTEGFCQILSHKETQAILGAIVIGHNASNLIGEMALAIENELTLPCVTATIHAHPTLAEGWLEAAALGLKTPIHLPPKRPS
jgi:dihydrolipoamide dehydrogenase